MTSVEQAQTIILNEVASLPARLMRLGAPVLDLILSEDVYSTNDSPPFDKALMDGFAIRAADLVDGHAEFDVIEEVTAGHMPQRMIGPGQAARIMTGAPIPEGATAVVVQERSRPLQGERVRLEDPAVRAGQNMLPRGREMRAGEKILAAGTRLRPEEIGVLAGLGKAEVHVVPRPRVTILSTGD